MALPRCDTWPHAVKTPIRPALPPFAFILFCFRRPMMDLKPLITLLAIVNAYPS
jgi:hypothetical protein